MLPSTQFTIIIIAEIVCLVLIALINAIAHIIIALRGKK